MSLRLIVRPEAEAEIAEAFDWYEGRVTGLGSDFLLAVDAAIQAISRNPEHYPQVHCNIRRALVRKFPYEIFYVVDDIRIVILSVFHARRNPKRWQERI